MEKKIVRIPRELGITTLAIEFRKDPTDERFQRLILHAVRGYITRGFHYLGKPITVNEFAQLMDIPHNKILAIMTDVADTMGYLNKDNSKQMMGMIASMSMQYAMQDRAKVEAQFNKLNRAQGDGYAPFISGEVNKTLKLLMESNKQLADSFNGFFNTSTTNVMNIFGNEGEEEEKEIIDITRAVEIIDENMDGSQKALSVSEGDRIESSNDLAQQYNLEIEDEVSAKIIKNEGDIEINHGQLMDFNEKDHKEDIAHKHLKALQEDEEKEPPITILPA